MKGWEATCEILSEGQGDAMDGFRVYADEMIRFVMYKDH